MFWRKKKKKKVEPEVKDEEETIPLKRGDLTDIIQAIVAEKLKTHDENQELISAKKQVANWWLEEMINCFPQGTIDVIKININDDGRFQPTVELQIVFVNQLVRILSGEDVDYGFRHTLPSELTDEDKRRVSVNVYRNNHNSSQSSMKQISRMIANLMVEEKKGKLEDALHQED